METQASVLGRYRTLFRVRGVPSLVLAMVVARVPTGCVSILLVLFVSSQFGAAIAGMATAVWTIGTAIVAPALGRMVDHGHGPQALRLTAAAQVVVVTVLLLSVLYAAPAIVVIVSSLLCGALMPPVAGVTRSLWKVLVPEELLSTAYSFEILLIDVLYVSGPLVASTFIVFGAPAWGIGITTACLIVGSIALSFSEPVRRYAVLGKGAYGDRVTKTTSLLRTPAIWMLLLACVGTMAFSGWVETLLPLFYNAQGQSFKGGVAISVWSIGSILGVFAFVRFQPKRRSRMALAVQLMVCTAVYMIVCAMLPLGDDFGFLAVAAVMFCVGFTVSPCTNLHYQLGGECAPPLQHAEMFSWLNTATSAGISLGALLAGNAVEHWGFEVSFMLPVAFVAGSFALSLVLALLVRSWEGTRKTGLRGATPSEEPR